MSIVIYKDTAANSIFIEDANGAQFLNSLQATVPITQITIKDLARQIDIVSDEDHTEFEDENGVTYQQKAINNGGTGTSEEVRDLLNTLFQSSGTPTAQIPNITSSLTINSVQGAIINYTLTADYGVGYEWDLSNVSGIVNVEGNVRKLIGGSSLLSGTYNIPVKAINYNGEDSETIVLTVSTPSFSNTKSVLFNNNDYLNITANTSNPLYRSGNSTGTAWTFSFWLKPSSSNNQNQTILSFGGNDQNNEGRVHIRYKGNNGSRRRMSLFYGTNFNNLELQTPVGSTTAGNWDHWIFIYDGGTTENGSGGINTSYSRFKIYKNGVLQTTSNSNSNFGFSGAINTEFFRISRLTSSGQYSRGSNFDELALWASDETANVSSIYNSGAPHDLDLLTSAPDHWWRMGDGDTFPILQDSQGTLDATMNNQTAADIQNDVP
jgi:hypothetical protein